MDDTTENYLNFDMVEGRTVATRVKSEFPLRLMLPKYRADATDGSREEATSDEALWCYMLNYGGGLLQGDTIGLEVSVGVGCSVVLASQGSTKVFKNERTKPPRQEPGATPSHPGPLRYHPYAEQAMRCRVGAGALLALLPQPVTCFKDARYRQRQRFDLPADGSGSLLLLDWVTAGRFAEPLGEAWAFSDFSSLNEVYLGGRLAFVDALSLNEPLTPPSGEGGGQLTVADRMGSVRVFGLALLVGPALQPAMAHIRASVASRGTYRDHHHRGEGGEEEEEEDEEGEEAGDGRDGAEEEEKRKRQRVGAAVPGDGGPLPALCSSSDLWLQGGDEHTPRGGGDGGVADGLVLRFATETTEEAHDALLRALAPLAARLGRLPFGPVAV